MKKCNNCNNNVDDNDVFCQYCGAKLNMGKENIFNYVSKKYLFNSLSDGKVEISIDRNKLTISRPGLISKISHGLSGDKTILINQITAIQLKKVGFSSGYIQFIVAGREERKSGVLKGEKDENIVYFDNFGKKKNLEYNNNAEEIKKYIEDFNSQSQNQIATPLSITQQSDKYDQLKKIKELFDNGTLTQEEFEREKEKILN